MLYVCPVSFFSCTLLRYNNPGKDENRLIDKGWCLRFKTKARFESKILDLKTEDQRKAMAWSFP